SLTGALGSIKGALAIAMAVARESPGMRLIMPASNAAVAAQVPDIVVQPASTLTDVVEDLASRRPLPQAWPTAKTGAAPSGPCLSDVCGQATGRRALEIAASGGHSLLMCGPPGVGKSMLAQRLPSLLPGLSALQSLEVAALQGVAGHDIAPSPLPPF